MRLLPLLLLISCATPGEVVQVVETVRSGERAEDRALMVEAVQPQIAAVADAVNDLREDNAETFGRALERVDHAAKDDRTSIISDAQRQSALTASERSTARRDAESRDHALGLRLDRHKAANEGSSRSMLADVKIVRMVATTAGITSSANSGRVTALEKRVEAEDADDASDHQRTLDALKAAMVARDLVYAEHRKADREWQAGVPADLQDKLLGIAGKVGGAVLLIGAAWAWFKKRAA